MGLIPIFAWTFFFVFFIVILSYNSLRQARARKNNLENILTTNPYGAEYKKLPNQFNENWKELKDSKFQDGQALLRLAQQTNELYLDDADWITLLKDIKAYQIASSTYFHLLKYQPTRLVAGILRWS
jgi:hypothetical protein